MKARNVLISRQSLAPLESILRSWIACIEHYIDIWQGEDLPYWYNERSNVGLLAGAAWRAGWIALEEYQMGKHGANSDEVIGGRNDLCLANSHLEYYIEAKVAYFDIANIDRSGSHLAEIASTAVQDARRLTYDGPRLAAVFIAPFAPNSQLDTAHIQSFVDMLEARRDDALAWVKPDLEKLPLSHDNRVYPLAALILIEV